MSSLPQHIWAPLSSSTAPRTKDTVPRTKLREHLCLVYLNTSEHPCEVAEYVPKTKVKVFRAGASSGKVKLKIL